MTKTRSGWVNQAFYKQTRSDAEAIGYAVAFLVGICLWATLDYLLVCALVGHWVREPDLPDLILAGLPSFWVTVFIGFYLMLAVSEPIIYLKCRRWVREHPDARPA